MLNKKNLLRFFGVTLVVATAVMATSAIVKPGHIKHSTENKQINIVKPGH